MINIYRSLNLNEKLISDSVLSACDSDQEIPAKIVAAGRIANPPGRNLVLKCPLCSTSCDLLG